MSTKRTLIIKKLVEKLSEISIANGFNTDLFGNVLARFIFPDTNPDLPLLCLTAGREDITYQPGGFQERRLMVIVRGYVSDEDDSIGVAEKLIQDVESCIITNERTSLDDGTTLRDIKTLAIETDEGVLAPLGLFEIEVEVTY